MSAKPAVGDPTTRSATAPIALPGPVWTALPAGPQLWQVEGAGVDLRVVVDDELLPLTSVPAGGVVFALPLGSTAQLQALATSPARLVAVRTGSDELLREWLRRVALDDEERIAAATLAEWQVNASLAEQLRAQRAARDAATLVRLRGAAGGADSERRWYEPIAAALHLPRDAFADAQPPLAPPSFDALPTVLRRLGVRARRVRLATTDVLRDAGPLLVRYRRGANERGGQSEQREWRVLHWQRGGYVDDVGRRAGLAQGEPIADAYALYARPASPELGFLSLVRDSRRELLAELPTLAAAAVAIALIGLVLPLATRSAFDDLLPSGASGQLVALGIALVLAALFAALFQVVQRIVRARIDGRGETRLAAEVADRVLRLPTEFFRGHTAGDLQQRIEHVERLRSLALHTVLSSGATLLTAIASFTLLLGFDARLTLVALLGTAVHAALVLLGRWRQRGPLAEAAALDGRLAGLTYELLEGVAKLRSAAAEPRALARWYRTYVAERGAAARGARVASRFAVSGGAVGIGQQIALFVVAALVVGASQGPGTLIGFLGGFAVFQAAFGTLLGDLLTWYAAEPLLARARALYAAVSEDEQEVAGRRIYRPRADPGALRGAIELSGIVFGYDAKSAPLLDGLSLRVEPGEHVAIVGGSGSGKSTLLRLLLGFETPRAGSIAYDGRLLEHLDVAAVRAQIGAVLQSSMLFAGTILDNIRGASDASLDACLDAASRAGLDADLASMGMGIHTPITEGGGTFSGGQKQRILVARAIVGAPRILFLDEATSALDQRTQAIVTRTLVESKATRVTIAHRLSTVRDADRIYVLARGQFVEQGDFASLMAQGGQFAALARRQLLDAS